jgi:SNF2 family DNA or RNA helicase
LLDPQRSGESSAKLDLLLERVQESLEGEHKALVFSQFTSLLAIVRQRLDAAGTPYAYIDGGTSAKDRASAVVRFQDEPECKLLLSSLKAGGVGLNLTAADYVFLLDPWWNPAAEAQAIGRAHRMGQQRSVFAYRFVSAGTIEERVLELQERKRELAAVILDGEATTLRDLTREDLERLLR